MTNDPRDKRYYQLQKKDISQLTFTEIEESLSYCERMIEYAGAKKARRCWITLKNELEAMLTNEENTL